MRVKLETLQKVVIQAVNEDRAVEQLKKEVTRVLGTAVIIEGKVEQLAEAANDQIDILESTGKTSHLNFDVKLMSRFTKHRNPHVRKLAARTVSQNVLTSMSFDKDAAVRFAVAKRMSAGAVKEMLKRFPTDDSLKVVYRQKRLTELSSAGGSNLGTNNSKVAAGGDEPFDIEADHAHKRGRKLRDARPVDGPELSEQWYKDKAFKFLQDYGGNIEYTWEEILARRYASSVKATQGVDIDEAKLLKAIKKLIEEREDAVLERDSLKETLAYLKNAELNEMLTESTMPALVEETDPVQALLESNSSPQDYVTQANILFKVQEADVPAAIKKYSLGEQNNRSKKIPVIGYLPHKTGFRAIDERALDKYCENWNARQFTQGEPLFLEWTGHPEGIGKVSFCVTLK